AAAALVVALAVGHPACAQAERSYRAGELVIATPWVRATPAGAKVGGGYVTITNSGTAPDWLIGGSLPGAASVEVHETSVNGGIAKMRRLQKGLEIAPGQTLELKPGGYHLMFQGLSAALKEGQSVTGTLVFQRAGTVEV